MAGTPAYMAPEQAVGQTLDQRADIFSLGSVLYQMVTGRLPFRASTTLAVLKRVAEDKPRAIREIIPETPQWLCDVIAKLHAKDPGDRCQSAREAADVLADCEARLKDCGRVPRNEPQPAGRGKWLAAAAAALLLTMIALAVLEFAGATHLFNERRVVNDANPSERKPEIEASPPGPKIEARLQVAPHPAAWVQLFNGKDLTGWTPAHGDWQVVNGEIVCKDEEFSRLYSERGDYENFHVKAEVRVSDGADCGLWVRARPDVATGYQASISGDQSNRPDYLMWWEESAGDCLIAQTGPLAPPETWLRVEMIARGPELTLLVNGRTIGRARDQRSLRGHIAFSTFWTRSTLRVRSVEIMELPPAVVTLFSNADMQRIAAQPAARQVEEVRNELIRRNPGFDGKMETQIEGGIVTELRIVSDLVTDVAPIRAFNALRVLQCSGTWTDKANGLLADLTPLEGMNLANLTHLELQSTKVTDAGLACFKDCKNLTHLNLQFTPVSDAGLACFKDCKNLTDLNLEATLVTDAGLACFKDCKKLLTDLRLSGTHVSDAGLVNFDDCKNLQILCLYATKVGDAGLAHFKNCNNLTGLWLFETQVSDAGLETFEDCMNLTYLSLSGTQVGDVGLAHFKNCKNLRTLVVPRTQVSDAGLATFKDCKCLTDLWLFDSKVSGLAPLKDMRLETIRLTPQNITPQGMAILRAMKSLKTIGVSNDLIWPAAEFWERYEKGEFKQ